MKLGNPWQSVFQNEKLSIENILMAFRSEGKWTYMNVCETDIFEGDETKILFIYYDIHFFLIYNSLTITGILTKSFTIYSVLQTMLALFQQQM